MIGLILFSHSKLAEAYRDTVRAITGHQEQIASIEMDPNASSEAVVSKLEKAITLVDDGDGVVIVTDLFGGSPANFSLAHMMPGKVEVVSGLNLAMLLKAIESRVRPTSPALLAKAMVVEGRDSIVLASEMLAKERSTLGTKEAT
jgi:PTS system mannose-specific IIA component